VLKQETNKLIFLRQIYARESAEKLENIKFVYLIWSVIVEISILYGILRIAKGTFSVLSLTP